MPAKKPLITAQKYLTVYLIINGLLLLSVNAMYFPDNIGDFLLAIPFFAFLASIGVFFLAYYYMLGLAYLHMMFGGAVLFFSGVMVFKERNWFLFVVTVLASAFSIWSNWFLMQH